MNSALHFETDPCSDQVGSLLNPFLLPWEYFLCADEHYSPVLRVSMLNVKDEDVAEV